MTKKSDTTNLSLIKSGRPKGPSAFDAVFAMEDDLRAVLDYSNVLVDVLGRDDEISPGAVQGLARIASEISNAGDRLMEQFNTALELARQEKRA